MSETRFNIPLLWTFTRDRKYRTLDEFAVEALMLVVTVRDLRANF